MKTEFNEGAVSLAKGPVETIVNFEALCRLDSADSRSLFDYADALRLVGRRKEARQVYKLLEEAKIPVDRRWVVPLFHGQTLFDVGLFVDAEQFFRIAAKLNPDTTVPCVYLAAALASQERFEDAVNVLQEAIHLLGDRDEVLLNLGLNLRALGRLNEAADYLQQSLSLSPQCEEAIEAFDDVKRALECKRIAEVNA